jgi:hypothetical protein
MRKRTRDLNPRRLQRQAVNELITFLGNGQRSTIRFAIVSNEYFNDRAARAGLTPA